MSPSVSVVVPTFRGAQRVRECLASLVAQTVSPDRVEVVVVHPGNDAEIPALVDDLRAKHSRLNLRMVEARGPDEGQARNVGIAAARGDYLTVVDPDDRPGPDYLEALLEEADPGVVTVAVVAEPDGRGSTDPALRRVAGRTLLASELPALFGSHTGTLVSTELARSAVVDPGLRSGADHAYWLSLFAQRQFRFRVLRAGDDATYHRMTRPSSSQGDDGFFDVVRRLECMRALEGVPRTDPSVARVARAVAEDLASGINSHLRAHPDQRPRVVAEAETMGVREVPWSTVNAGLARDLAICYCFPPDNDTSGLVAAKRIRGRGVVTDVVSHDLSWIRDVDPLSLRVPGEFLGRHHVVRGTASFTGWTHLSRFAKEAVATVDRWEAEQGSYATLYSRAMAVSSHYAAALVKARRPEIRWTAEFSDPMRFNIFGEERPDEVAWDWLSHELADAMCAAGHQPVLRPEEGLRLFEWVERLVYALADEITFTNDQQRRLMIEHCEDPALAQRAMEISQVHAHPVLPRPFYELAPVDLDRTDDAVQLAYFGAFYQTRHLGDLVQALLRLRQDERERLRLRVYTPDPSRLTLELARLGLAGTVTAHHYRPVLEFLNLTTHFDVLVLDDARTSGSHDVNPYLPSKLSDYRGSGTPIWAIAEPGSVMSSLQFEYESTLGDVDQAVAVLRELVRERVST
nr:glycosyltransferase [Marmoricola sp. URHB0036]